MFYFWQTVKLGGNMLTVTLFSNNLQEIILHEEYMQLQKLEVFFFFVIASLSTENNDY